MNEVIREFLLETHENLGQLDADLLSLEKDPHEKQTLARAFRTLHSVKGTAGFIGLPRLEAVAHSAESLLSKLRSGELTFNRPIASAILAVVDAIRRMLASIEHSGDEGDGDYSELIARLDRLRESGGVEEAPTPPAPSVTLPPPPPPAPVATPAQAPVPAAPAAQPSPYDVTEVRAPAVADSALRVDVGLLDKLMNLVGELVLARNQIMQLSTAQEDGGLQGPVQRLNLLTTELQANVMKTRMQPIANVWSKFPRIVRDLALACGKKVRFEMDGQDTELDKTIIEAIRDPLTHMVRNAVDHGIEPPDIRAQRGKPQEGRLALHAFHEGGKVIIELSDDGAGIDPARVRDRAIRTGLLSPEDAVRMSEQQLANLIFLPGLSTAERVTQFSGRGVGMDVVRTNIERIGGTVDLQTTPGRGTTVRMKIPLTLAIIPALTVSASGERFFIPQSSLLELVHLDGEQAQKRVEDMQGAPVYRLRGSLLPLIYLGQQLQLPPRKASEEGLMIVVLQADDRQLGLVVDAIHDTEEIVVKPLQKQLKGVGVFAGATIMGDGKAALILDVMGLAQRAGVVTGARGRALAEKPSATGPTASKEALLVFTGTDSSRMAIPLAQVARLEELPRASVERAGRQRVVQYRGEVLPLIDVAREMRRLERGGRRGAGGEVGGEGDTLQVIVHSSEGRHVGLVVGEIVDIVEEEVTTRARASRPGVLFCAPVQGHITELLDLRTLLHGPMAEPGGLAEALTTASLAP
jgi:two-component system chemotaxis sensor kinase CheA